MEASSSRTADGRSALPQKFPPVPLSKLQAHYRSSKQVEREWKALERENVRDVQHKRFSSLRETSHLNRKRNRYSGGFTLDHTRVRLGVVRQWDKSTIVLERDRKRKRRDGGDGSLEVKLPQSPRKLSLLDNKEAFNDFVNANFISNQDGSAAYIAAQAPTSSAIGNFWRMIWEQESPVVVMLSKLVENSNTSWLMNACVFSYLYRNTFMTYLVPTYSCLILLTRNSNDALVRSNKIKVDRYWPEAESNTCTDRRRRASDSRPRSCTESSKLTEDGWTRYGDIYVKLLDEVNKENDIVVRTIAIRRSRDLSRRKSFTNLFRRDLLPPPSSGIRSVVQIQFEGWPDHGVPENISGVAGVLEEMERVLGESELKGPPVIHCSAGVGRTGSLIAIHSELMRVREEANGKPNDWDPLFNVPKVVRRMRENRRFMVQKAEQYVFVYDALFHLASKEFEKKTEPPGQLTH